MSEAKDAKTPEEIAAALNEDVHEIHDALGQKYLPQVLISKLIGRSNEDVNTLCKAYFDEFKRDLNTEIKTNASGPIKKIAVALTMDIRAYEASCLQVAAHTSLMHSFDTDVVSEILCTRTPEELKEIMKVYSRSYGADFMDVIEKNMNKKVINLKNLYKMCLSGERKTEANVEELAGTLARTSDKKVFVDIIGGHSRAVLQKVAEAFIKVQGKSLIERIKARISGRTCEALIALILPVPQYLSQKLHGYFHQRMGVDIDGVTRIMVCTRETIYDNMNSHLSEGPKGQSLLMLCRTRSPQASAFKRMLMGLCYNWCTNAR